MSKLPVNRSPAPALLLGLLAACGGPASRMGQDVDPYNGIIDNTFGAPSFTGTNTTPQGALAPQFQPTTPASSKRSQCSYVDASGLTQPSNSCYLPQLAFASGQPISFFVAGIIKPLPFATLPSSVPVAPCDAATGFNCAFAASMADHRSDGGGGWHADVFPHSCKPAGFNPVTDAYPRDQQYSIVSALPINNLTNTSALPPLGAVAVYGVTGVSGETCNDLKYASSIGDKTGGPGHFGAVRSDKPTGYEAWMVFDPAVPVLKSLGPKTALVSTSTMWFNGLQGTYLSGGPIPTDSAGNLIAMDGITIDSGGSFASPTSDNVVILPYQPGDDGYSPIVRLHDYKTSKSAGFYQGICQPGAASCPANFVKLSNTCATSSGTECVGTVFNTILVVASPQ